MAINTAFKPASTAVKQRLIAHVMGREKSGKTNFSLTAPDPIILFDFDYGLEGVVHKFATSKKIYTSEYRIHEISPGKFVAEWDRFKNEFKIALNDPEVRSVVWDTGTEVWELLRMARFGKLTQVMPHNYGPVNAEMRGLIRDAYSSDKNFIIVNKMTEQYLNDKPTGKFVFQGFKDIPYSSQINIHTQRNEDNEFQATIVDCRQNAAVMGIVLEGPLVDFQVVLDMVFS